MADDLDDLLDEVETKYCAKDKFKEKSKKHGHRKTVDDDLDDVLNDITVDTDFKPLGKVDVPTNQSRQRPESARRCFPVYIGGAFCALGMANSMNKKSCDKLMCTSCDFKLVSFENFEWDPATDYLFLRNNTPDFDRLKSNLIPKKGFRAYCCQCSHRSVKEVMQLSNDPNLKWVCGKH